jgi:hypothetical protein
LSFWRCNFSFSHTNSTPNVNENLHKLTLMLLLPQQVINSAKSMPIDSVMVYELWLFLANSVHFQRLHHHLLNVDSWFSLSAIREQFNFGVRKFNSTSRIKNCKLEMMKNSWQVVNFKKTEIGHHCFIFLAEQGHYYNSTYCLGCCKA